MEIVCRRALAESRRGHPFGNSSIYSTQQPKRIPCFFRRQLQTHIKIHYTKCHVVLCNCATVKFASTARPCGCDNFTSDGNHITNYQRSHRISLPLKRMRGIQKDPIQIHSMILQHFMMDEDTVCSLGTFETFQSQIAAHLYVFFLQKVQCKHLLNWLQRIS